MLEGIDFSFGSGLTAAQIKAGGKAFVCRYLSVPGNPKNISRAEFGNYLNAGIAVILNYEESGHMPGRAQGEADARAADSQARGLGAEGAVLFFSLDIDPATPGALGPALDYMRGVNAVIGAHRSGGYGGLGFIRAAFDAGVISYGWQTYAWSGGQWDNRARLRQYHNDVRFGPAAVDLDQAAFFDGSRVLGLHDDFGQWPRPSAPAPKPPAPSPAPPPAPSDGPPYRHVAPQVDGESLGHVAEARGTTVDHIVATSVAHLSPQHLSVLQAYVALEDAMTTAGMARPVMPAGLVYFTDHP